ncbi:MAG: HEAT repeat domain-containing protein [Promethearchaeota archaeon]
MTTPVENSQLDIKTRIDNYFEAFEELIKNKTKNLKELKLIVQSIAQFNTWQIIEPLEKILDKPGVDNKIKELCLTELGKFGDPRTIKIITKYISPDVDLSLRKAAIKALSFIKNPKVVPYLIDALKDGDKWNKIFAIYGLKKNESKKIVGPLVSLLGDDEKEVREEALNTLESFNEDLIKEDVIAGLDSDNKFVKYGCIAIVGNKQIIDAAPKLSELLNDKDQRLSILSARALSKLKDPNTIPKLIIKALEKGGGLNIYSIAIFKMGNDIIPVLIKLYLIANNDKIKTLIEDILEKFGVAVEQYFEKILNDNDRFLKEFEESQKEKIIELYDKIKEKLKKEETK